MSRAPEPPRPDDAGFSIIEVIVALVIFALAAAALTPLFVLGARTAISSRLEAAAKGTAQERLEAMRQLAFHVDRQNGPFVDLLDNYYPSRAPAAGTGAGWVSETGTRRAGEPATGSFYRVVLDPVPGRPGFTQSVATQFLTFSRAPVAQAAFASYDSQQPTVDSPPSYFLGVTVITNWVDAGAPRSFETFTQISDPTAVEGLVSSRARAVALRVESTEPDLDLTDGVDAPFLTAEAATATADGRLADGSSATAQLTAGRATRSEDADVEAASATAVGPGGAQPGAGTSSPVTTNPGLCGYAAFGRGSVTGATSAIVSGVPVVPATAGTGAAPAAVSTAALLQSPGGSCGAFWFSNLGTFRASLALDVTRPLVAVTAPSGAGAAVRSTAWVNGSAQGATPAFVRSGATADTAERVGLFHPAFAAGEPLVRVQLVSSSIECDSRTATAATAAYRVVVDYRRADGSRELLVDTTWSSTAAATPDPLAAIDLTTKVVRQGGGGPQLTLADYIGSWSLGRTLTEGGSGIAGVEALRVTTVPVRSDPASSVGVVLGALSCVADDQR